MTYQLSQLAELVGGQLSGDPQLAISDAGTIRDAEAGHLTFLTDAKYLPQLKDSKAAAVLVTADIEVDFLPHIVVDDVAAAFAEIVGQFRNGHRSQCEGISPHAFVSPTARIERNVSVFPHAFIGQDVEIGEGCVIHSGARLLDGCKLGKNVTVYPNVVMYEDTQVGDNVIIHSGAVLGAYGFGYDSSSGRHILSAQLGNVVVEQDAEIGANTTIDRGTYGPTIIGQGTKLDNMVMIAHNCRIGRHNMICSQVGIAGSCTTGDYVVMAGQVGIKDHLHIGDQAVLGAKTGLKDDVPAKTRMFGIPGTPEREQMVKQAALSKLPEMRKQLKRLQKHVDELSQTVAAKRAA